MYRIDTQGRKQGHDHRYQKDERCRGFHEGAGNQQHQIDQQQQNDGILRKAQKTAGQPSGDIVDGSHPAENRSGGDNKHDDCGNDRAFDENWAEIPGGEFPVNEQSHDN